MINIILPALIATLLLRMGAKIQGRNWYGQAVYKVAVFLKLKRLKPFDCVKCMSGWLCLPWVYFTDKFTHENYWPIIPYMLGAIAMGYFMEKLYEEL